MTNFPMDIVTISEIIVGILLALLIVFSLPWQLQFKGALIVNPVDTTAEGKLFIGGKKFGIGFELLPERTVFIGNFHCPFLSLPIRRKGKKGKGQLKRSARRMKPVYLPLGRALLKGIRFNQVEINGKVGLPNPMHTGLIFGYSHLLPTLIPKTPVRLNMEPQFSNQWDTHLQGTLRLTFSPVYVTWQAVKSYFKFKD